MIQSGPKILLFGLILCVQIQLSQATPLLETTGANDSLSPFSVGISQNTSASYFNPAGLSFSQAQLSTGLLVVHQALELTFFDRPTDSNISDRIYQAQTIDPKLKGQSAALPSANLKTRSLNKQANQQVFMRFGLIKKLWKDRISLGLHTLLPLHRFEFQAPSFVDERAQYFDNQLKFERWGDTLEGLTMALGLGLKLNHQFSMGLGLTMLNRAIASSKVFLSDASYEGLSVVSPQVEVYSALSPSLSFMWYNTHKKSTSSFTGDGQKSLNHSQALKPVKASSVFVTLLAPQEVKVDGQSQVKIWNYPYQEGQDSIIQRFSQSYRSLPLRVRWGGELPLSHSSDLSHSDWAIFTGGQWTQWSKYIDRVSEDARWSDQFELSGGLKWSKNTKSLSGDLRWRPSPVPTQSGRSSYVDPHQIAVALNGNYPLAQKLDLRLSVQGHALLHRVDRKDLRALNPVIDEFPASVDQVTGEVIEESLGLQSNNPGYPGYESSGWVWVAGVQLIWYE